MLPINYSNLRELWGVRQDAGWAMNENLENKVDRLGQFVAQIGSQLDALVQQHKLSEEIQAETVTFFTLLMQKQQQGFEALTDGLNRVADQSTGAGVQELRRLADSMRHEIKVAANNLAALTTGQFSSLKQTVNLSMREASGQASGRVRCVFLVHRIEMWDALVEVYQAMAEDARFEPIVISIPSRSLGRGDFGGEDLISRSLSAQNIPHLRFDMPDHYEALNILKNIKPDVIFRQQQWDPELPPAFHAHELTFARICIVPYAALIIQTHDIYEKDPQKFTRDGYDQIYHRLAWRIFCETTLVYDTYRQLQHAAPEKLVLSGYPKFDRLLKSRGRGHWPVAEPRGRSHRIIWAPHHSVGGESLGFGVFHEIYRQMIEWARQSPDLQFVLKPHPSLYTGLVAYGKLSPDQVNAFLADWNALPNCGISEGQYGELFAASDLMLTDGVSFLVEYPLFDKPLIYFDSGRHVPFNDLGRIAVSAGDVVRDFDSMKRMALRYVEGAPIGFEVERALLKRLLVPNEAAPVDTILDSIASGILAPEVSGRDPIGILSGIAMRVA